MDESPDELFYAQPRFVTHIDDMAIQAVTQLYREYLPPFGTILDLMSSWISHLPEEVRYGKVVGLGMNKQELEANKRLDEYQVQNLNTNPALNFEDDTFDGVGICVSIDYLNQPVEVIKELGRITKPGAPLIITFSNRCFPTKAVAIWHALREEQRPSYVAKLLQESGKWKNIEMMDQTPSAGHDPLYAVIGKSA